MKMKKITALLAAGLLAAGVIGCGGSLGTAEPAPEEVTEEEEAVEEEEEPAAEEEAPEEVTEEEEEVIEEEEPAQEEAEEAAVLPDASVLFRIMEEEKYYYDFGDSYVQSRQDAPFLQIMDVPGGEDAAFSIQADLQAKAEALRMQLVPDFDAGSEAPDPDYVREAIKEDDLSGIFYDGSIRAYRADSAVISVLLSGYCDNEAAAHPTSAMAAWNYSPAAGTVLGLSDIAVDQNNLITVVLTMMREEIRDNEDGRYEGLQDIGPEELSIFVADGSWYLDEEGLVIVISEDIIAPHAAGSFAFHVDYEDLKGVLKDAYMPAPEGAEDDSSADVSSMVRIENFADQAPEGAIAGITLDEDGTPYVLTASSEVYDFRVCRAVYEDENDTDPDEGGRFFSASRLAEGEYIILKEIVPEGLPSTLVCWKDAAGTLYRRTVSMSGEDGSMLLTAAD